MDNFEIKLNIDFNVSSKDKNMEKMFWMYKQD